MKDLMPETQSDIDYHKKMAAGKIIGQFLQMAKWPDEWTVTVDYWLD